MCLQKASGGSPYTFSILQEQFYKDIEAQKSSEIKKKLRTVPVSNGKL